MAKIRVPFSYLDKQFAGLTGYLDDVRRFVKSGDFTLGKPLAEFERRYAKLCGAAHVIGVGSGTDALIMPLKMLGVGPGDEVITTPMTFVATVGAIAATGAKTVFVDSEDGFVIDPEKIEAAITPRTRAILPVHYTGNAADMPAILEIARRRGLRVVEDACQAIGASIAGKTVGSFGDAAGFSLHPLKNLNVWGDGGMIATNSAELDEKLRLYRNHGLVGRDEVAVFGINSRFDTLQAVIGNRLIGEIGFINNRRQANALRYDKAFADMGDFITIPKRRPGVRHVFHLYIVRVKERDELLAHLNARGIEAKIHYPIPMHLQKAAKGLGYKKGDFPVCEAHCRDIITLPCHQHLSQEQVEHAVSEVRAFYLK